jgi:hypothetical protein
MFCLEYWLKEQRSENRQVKFIKGKCNFQYYKNIILEKDTKSDNLRFTKLEIKMLQTIANHIEVL